MATAAKYPTAGVTIADFFGEQPGQPAAELILNTTINATDLSIVSTTAIPASWPAAGRLVLDGEVIGYASFAGSTFTISGVGQRGLETAYGAAAASGHTAGAALINPITSQAHNQVLAEIVAVETALRRLFATYAAADVLASTGYLRIPNAQGIYARNAANTANLKLLSNDGSDNIDVGDPGIATPVLQLNAAAVKIPGYSTAAAAGTIRLPNVSRISSRNAANSADIVIIGSTAADHIEIATNGQQVDIAGNIVHTGTFASFAATPAASGTIRLPNNTLIAARNAANGADLSVIGTDASDALKLGSTAGYQRVLFEFTFGNSGASPAVDWNNGDTQAVTVNAATATFAFSNPVKGRTYILKLTQDGTGSRIYAWPAAVKWSNGTAPTGSGANKRDIVSFYYDGTDYFGSYLVNYT